MPCRLVLGKLISLIILIYKDIRTCMNTSSAGSQCSVQAVHVILLFHSMIQFTVENVE